MAYFVVRLLQVALYSLATGDMPETRRAILRLAPGFVGGPALLIVAGFLDGYAQGVLWAVALAVDYGVAYVRAGSGFRVHAGHFVERHGLIVIIALGESIVAIGVGASGLALGAGVVVAAVLGIALAAALWWAYFDLVMLFAERRLSMAKGDERAWLARDSYSYLHLPMVAGIIFAALGIKEILAHVGDPLGTIPAVALCGVVALYLSWAQRLQAARRRQCERSQVGGGDPLWRARLLSGVGSLAHHPRHPSDATVCTGRLRDDEIS